GGHGGPDRGRRDPAGRRGRGRRRSPRDAGAGRRRRAAPQGVRAPRGVPQAQGQASHARVPDRGGVGLGLLRRHAYAGRPREAAASEDRAGSPKPCAPRHRSRARLPVRGLVAYTAGCPIAVIDIGSNSGRVVVVELTPEGHLAIVADARSPLRLARDVAQSGRLGTAAIERTIQALRDFQAVARGAGAERVVAVATAAVRTAEDRDELVVRVREETGLE